jgi:hypothetical protein
MTAIVKAPLHGEIIAPGEGITLVVAPHPLSVSSTAMMAPAGLSLAELVEFARLRSDTALRTRFVVTLEGERIDRDLWHCVRPKPGTLVIVRAVAEGGDNGLLRSLLSLAVVAIGVFVAPMIAPALGLSVGLVGSAITIAGQLLISALFPVGQPQLGSNTKSQTYSISGGQNAADPFGVVPANLGRHRVYPKLAAKPYTEFSGADQYLRMLFTPGYGPLDITDLKIGETPLTDFDDVEVEVRNGYASDTPVTIYPREVVQDDLSVELTQAGGWQQRTTAANIDEISIDVVAPNGIVRIDDKGKSQNFTVAIEAEYQLVGGSTWTQFVDVDLKARSTDAIRKGYRQKVATGQYNVRVRRTTADTDDEKIQDQVVWSALRGFRNSPPVSFSQPLALIALRIRATAQLNGVVDRLNCICTSRTTAFSGSAWIADQPSRNPADLFRLVLQGPANAQAQADLRLDLETIERWWQYCDDEGFTFDQVRDFSASVQSTLGDICAAGRAAPIFRDGKWSVVWDEPDAPIVQHFTPRNSWGFSGHRTYTHLPHAFRVRFINAENGFQQDERIVYDDGYDASNATLFEEIEFPGVTDPDTIWRFGRFHIAQARLRPEIYQLTVDVEHLVSTRGDRVRVTHDVPMWGLVSGRVKATDPGASTVTIDEPLLMESGKTYALRFRLSDGTSLYRTIVTDDGEQTTVTLTGTGGMPAAGDLFMAGEAGEESVVLRIKSITPDEGLNAKITFVDDAPEISDADTGTIPAFDSHITVPPALFHEKPVNLRLNEGYQGTGDNIVTGVFFSWETVAGQFPTGFEAQFGDHDGDGIYKPAGIVTAPKKQVFITDYQSGQWNFRVRALFADNSASEWAVLDDQTLTEGGTIIPREIGPGSVNVQALANELLPLITAIFTGDPGSVAAMMLNLREEMDDLAAAVSDLSINQDRRVITVERSLGTAHAKISEETLVRASETDAAAAKLDITQAQFNDGIATVESLVTAVANDLSAETTTRSQQVSQLNDSLAIEIEERKTVATDLAAEVTARQTLGTQVNNDLSALTTTVNSAVGPSGSITSQVTDLFAKYNDVSAEGAVGFSVGVAPSGVTARYVVAIKVGGDLVAAQYLDVVPDGAGGYDGRFAVIADRFYMLDVDEDYVSAPFSVEAGFTKITEVLFEHMSSLDGSVDIEGRSTGGHTPGITVG